MSNTIILILFFFFIGNSLCESIEKLVLSSRISDTINTKERDYFGLFPGVQEFSSAILYHDNNSKYFKIKTESSEFDLPVSDSSVLVLTTIIDNFEDILSKKKLMYVNPKLLTNLISIYTRINDNLKIINIKLKDGSELAGYIILSDSNSVVMMKDSISRQAYSELTAIHYSKIYSISDIEYPIIDCCREVFLDNEESLLENSYYVNPKGYKVAPPEVYEFLSKQIPVKLTEQECNYDYDDLYEKKFMITLDISQQVFNLKGIPTTRIGYPLRSSILLQSGYDDFNPFSFLDYFSIGISIDYSLLNNLRINIGTNYENIGFNILKGVNDNSLYGYTLNFNISYNYFNTRKYNYQNQQFLFDLFIGFQMHKFSYFNENNFSDIKNWFDTSILEYDITKKVKYSYKFGLNIRYKINNLYFWKISGFINYHDDYGLIIPQNGVSTRYLHYIYSFGISGGFGLEI